MDGPTTPTTRPPLSRRRRRRRRRRLHGGLLLLVVGAALAAALASRGGVEAAAAAFLPLPVPAMPAAEAGTSTASSATTPGMAKRAVCSGNDDGRWRRPRPPASQPLGLLPALGRLAALAIPALGGLLGATSFLTPSTAATAASATRAVVTLDTLGSSGSSNSNAGAAAARGNGGIDYACLLGRCGRELGQALLDPRGMHELACLVTCGPSDLACQMRCGDMYQEDVLQRFHACAISKHQCVPQHVEATAVATQVPSPSLLVPSLDLNALKGEWYIAYGLNPTMDCFPCQHHTAIVEEDEGQQLTTSSDSSNKPPPPAITFDVTYRVPHSGMLRTFDRRLQQRFEQDPQHPGLIHARDFGYLKQEDDWYILAADPSSYMVAWYRGCNRAWCGYTGGVVYSRAPQLAPEALPAVKEAAAKAGVSFERMCPTDNSCALQQQEPPLRRQKATAARTIR